MSAGAAAPAGVSATQVRDGGREEACWCITSTRPARVAAHARPRRSDLARSGPDGGAAAGAEIRELVVHPLDLAGAELRVTGVVGVVHVVVDRVGARCRAGVL